MLGSLGKHLRQIESELVVEFEWRAPETEVTVQLCLIRLSLKKVQCILFYSSCKTRYIQTENINLNRKERN